MQGRVPDVVEHETWLSDQGGAEARSCGRAGSHHGDLSAPGNKNGPHRTPNDLAFPAPGQRRRLGTESLRQPLAG